MSRQTVPEQKCALWCHPLMVLEHHCLFLGVNTDRLKVAEISNFLYNLDLNKPCLRRSQSPLWISTCISAA